MSRRIVVRPRAERDLNEQFLHIARDSRAAAERFIEATQATLERLAAMPELGGVWELPDPKLAGIRVWQVPGFENWLVFYRATEDVLEVVRVLHGARDIGVILGQGQ